MPPTDTEYLEGDIPAGNRSFRHLWRVAGFLVPHRRLVLTALVFMLGAIGLELVMPFITRTAIDRYLVPYCVKLDTDKIAEQDRRLLTGAVPENGRFIRSHYWYLRKKHWRDMDPALTGRIRSVGAVGERQWYAAVSDDRTDRLAERYPNLFVQAGSYRLIAGEDLQKLAASDLKTLRGSDARGLVLMSLLFACAACALLGVSYCQSVYLEQAGQLMMLDLRLHFFGHILDRSLMFFSRNSVGKLVTRLNNDVQNMAELFRNMLIGLFKDLLMFAGIAAVMFALNARLAVLCMLVVPVMAGTAFLFARISKKIFRRLKGYTGRLNTQLQETLAGMTAVKLLGAQGPVLDRLIRTNRRYFRAGIAQIKMFVVFTPLMEFLGSFAVALIIWYGGGIVIQDRLSLGTLVAFITYMQMLLVPVRNVSEKYNQLQGALASVERIFSVLDAPPASLPQNGSDIRPSGADHGKAAVAFVSVCFGYESTKPVFDDLDLVVPRNQVVAVVGPSGSGKSTLVNLLLRLYEPRRGCILLDGRPLDAFSREEMADRVALVSQESVLLSSSLKHNITLGRSSVTQEMLNTALSASGTASWLDTLPQGIDTPIGEGGRILSQGQYQMLALARALAGDPRILILDEAFSQVDPRTEQRITRRLAALMAGRTCIMVAHRLSTARQADRILVMREGRIVQDGDHPALMAAGGFYADMVTLDNNLESGREVAACTR